MFFAQAKTDVIIKFLDKDELSRLRLSSISIDDQLTNLENFFSRREDNIICDYNLYYDDDMKVDLHYKMKLAVRRALILNDYKHKKKFRLAKIIEILKKKNYEESQNPRNQQIEYIK